MRKILAIFMFSATALSQSGNRTSDPINAQSVNYVKFVGVGNYSTVQKALTDACAQNGGFGVVEIEQGATPADGPTLGGEPSYTITGCTNSSGGVPIVDMRSATAGTACYAYSNPTTYVAGPCSTAASSGFNLPAALAASPYCVTMANAGYFLVPDGSTNGVIDCESPLALPTNLIPDGPTRDLGFTASPWLHIFGIQLIEEAADNSGSIVRRAPPSGVTGYTVIDPAAVGTTGQAEVCTVSSTTCTMAWKTVCQSGGTGCPSPAINGITALTGDVTASGPGSVAATLAAVNTGTINCGDATHVCQLTTNNKGLVTANSAILISAPTATNLSGGALGSAPCQSAANTTTFVPSPTVNIVTAYFFGWAPSGSATPCASFNFQTVLNAAQLIIGTQTINGGATGAVHYTTAGGKLGNDTSFTTDGSGNVAVTSLNGIVGNVTRAQGNFTLVGINKASPQGLLDIATNASVDNAFVMSSLRSNSTDRNWRISLDQNVEGQMDFMPSTAQGNYTFSTTALSLTNGGAVLVPSLSSGGVPVCSTTGGQLTSTCSGTALYTAQFYWNLQSALFATGTMLGPVWFAPMATTHASYNFSTRSTGSISCTGAPVINLMDLGTSPATVYGSATSLQTLTVSLSSGGVSNNAGGSINLTAGHYYGVAFSSGTCVTAPVIDATLVTQ